MNTHCHKKHQQQCNIIKTIISCCLFLYSASAAIQVEAAPDLKDLRDGGIYKTVKIGNQIWMAENLNFKTHNSYCLGNDSKQCNEAGRFYKWRSATSACPNGWRLPSREDWIVLKNTIENTEKLYKWDDDNPEIGYLISAPNFNVLTTGVFDIFGQHQDIGGFFWTSSQAKSKDNAICTFIDDLNPDKTVCEYSKHYAMPIRCIQGKDTIQRFQKNEPTVIMGKYIDSRDKKEYKTVQINQQTWLAENLKYETKNSVCHNNDPAECEKYGRLYKWADVEIACPEGWHLPSKYEIKRLLWAVGDEDGDKLKSKTGWNNGNNGWDDFGFNVFPVGSADFSEANVRFDFNGDATAFWTSTRDGRKGYYKWFFFNASWNSKVDNTVADWVAEPIRCIKNYDYDVTATGILEDKRDRKKYKTVTIGNQIWMAENLDYNVKGSQCYDGKQKSTCKEGDRLYTWEQAKDACPNGWHLPSKNEWKTLDSYIDFNGNILKSQKQWSKEKGTDEVGFNALPIGSTKKKNQGKATYFWTSETVQNNKTNAMELFDHIDVILYGFHDLQDGLSIRCIANTNNSEE